MHAHATPPKRPIGAVNSAAGHLGARQHRVSVLQLARRLLQVGLAAAQRRQQLMLTAARRRRAADARRRR
eukprot:366162-Chlamydomonas_euryale.AAC.4